MATISAVPPVTSTGLATPLVMATAKGSNTAIMGTHHQMLGAHHHMEKQNMQHAILFLQQEHSRTLSGLHAEIKHLQTRCSDMTAQITLQNINDRESAKASSSGSRERSKSARSLKKRFEAEIQSLKKDADIAQSQVDEKDKKINFLEGQLRGREQRYHDELKLLQSKKVELEHQLDIKAASVAHLTAQMHKTKLKEHNRTQQKQQLREQKQKDRQAKQQQSPARETTNSPAAANAAAPPNGYPHAAETTAVAETNNNTEATGGVVKRIRSTRKKAAPTTLLDEVTNVALEKQQQLRQLEGSHRLADNKTPTGNRRRSGTNGLAPGDSAPARRNGPAMAGKPRPPDYEEMIRISQSSHAKNRGERPKTTHRDVLPPIETPPSKKL